MNVVFVGLIASIVVCLILHYSEVAIIHYIDNVLSIRAFIHLSQLHLLRACYERNMKFIIHNFIFLFLFLFLFYFNALLDFFRICEHAGKVIVFLIDNFGY